MRKTLIITGLSALLLFSFCKSNKGTSPSSKDPNYGDTRTEAVQLINKSTYRLSTQSTDSTYGYTRKNPVKVGGINDGPSHERMFLNALLGPNGEEIQYERQGSCCAFKTPNGLFENTGLLDNYEVYWEGCKDTLHIYINMYDKGNLYIPVGLKAKR